MTKIKFCGIRRVEDIFFVNKILPEYVGFIFFEKSFRYVDEKKFIELKKILSEKILSVGVFVDEKISVIEKISKNLDLIQLHGSEDENYISTLKNFTDKKIIKAFKIKNFYDLEIAEKSSADYILLDGGAGDGKTFDWNFLKNFRREYFLAGGLNCKNIYEAIKILNPFAVDVSSGIETNKFKDFDKMLEFTKKVRK